MSDKKEQELHRIYSNLHTDAKATATEVINAKRNHKAKLDEVSQAWMKLVNYRKEKEKQSTS